MIGSQGLKSADAARNSLPLQHSSLPGLQGYSSRKTSETQLLNFRHRDVFQPAPQPAVGAGQASPHTRPELAANDTVGSKRRGRYNWDGRYLGKPASAAAEPSLGRRVLVPVAGLALLAGVAFGAFYFMHTFAADPGAAPVAAAKPQTVMAAAAATTPAVTGSTKAVTASDGAAKQAATPEVAGRVASADKVGMGPALAVGAANVKVLAPDNARWGKATDSKPSAAPAGQANAAQANAPAAEADNAQAKAPEAEAAVNAAAAPDVKDPQSAPVPTEAPKKLAYAAPEPKQAHPVDRAVTASLPPAKAPQDTTPPGVDPNLLSVPASTSAKAAEESVAGGYMSKVKSGVRMHSGAGNHTGTVGVIPDHAVVQVLHCDVWCKVSYNGRQGYIYKTFLGGHSVAVAAKPAPAAPAAPAQAQAQEPQKKTAEAATAAPSTNAMEEAGQQTMTRGR